MDAARTLVGERGCVADASAAGMAETGEPEESPSCACTSRESDGAVDALLGAESAGVALCDRRRASEEEEEEEGIMVKLRYQVEMDGVRPVMRFGGRCPAAGSLLQRRLAVLRASR